MSVVLPDEMFLNILSYLNDPRDVLNASLVSKQYQRLFYKDAAWSSIIKTLSAQYILPGHLPTKDYRHVVKHITVMNKLSEKLIMFIKRMEFHQNSLFQYSCNSKNFRIERKGRKGIGFDLKEEYVCEEVYLSHFLTSYFEGDQEGSSLFDSDPVELDGFILHGQNKSDKCELPKLNKTSIIYPVKISVNEKKIEFNEIEKNNIERKLEEHELYTRESEARRKLIYRIFAGLTVVGSLASLTPYRIVILFSTTATAVAVLIYAICRAKGDRFNV